MHGNGAQCCSAAQYGAQQAVKWFVKLNNNHAYKCASENADVRESTKKGIAQVYVYTCAFKCIMQLYAIFKNVFIQMYIDM